MASLLHFSARRPAHRVGRYANCKFGASSPQGSAFFWGRMELYELLGNRKILLVADDPWIRDSLGRFLLDEGCRVIALGGVPSGRIGLETNRFDVVICDHGPPRLDGLAYLALARRALPDAILILLTGDRAEDVRPEAEHAGVDEVIGKPFTVETMERSIERALQRLDGTGRRGPLST